MTKILTKNEWIEKAKLIHNNLYIYDLVKYVNSRSKVIIICPVHNKFTQVANRHLLGAGCYNCSNHVKYTKESYIKAANESHNFKYNYDKLIYVNLRANGIINCNQHGDFEQNLSNHLRGRGCQFCFLKRKSSNAKVFIAEANNIHNNQYDYSSVNYINNYTKIIIICKQHGEFIQSPGSHLNGRSCHKCNRVISKVEALWLDSLNINNDYRQKSIKINNKNYRVDAYDSLTNTIYEFYGDYWHGNPIKYNLDKFNASNKLTFRSLYNAVLKREIIFKQAGYNIISIWEYDFKKF